MWSAVEHQLRSAAPAQQAQRFRLETRPMQASAGSPGAAGQARRAAAGAPPAPPPPRPLTCWRPALLPARRRQGSPPAAASTGRRGWRSGGVGWLTGHSRGCRAVGREQALPTAAGKAGQQRCSAAGPSKAQLVHAPHPRSPSPPRNQPWCLRCTQIEKSSGAPARRLGGDGRAAAAAAAAGARIERCSPPASTGCSCAHPAAAAAPAARRAGCPPAAQPPCVNATVLQARLGLG